MPVTPPPQYASLIDQAGARYGVPTGLLAAQEQVESGFDPRAVSPAGAVGIAQFLPSTAASLGVNPWDPASAIPGEANYLQQLFQRCGSWNGALQAYNSGSCAGAQSYAQEILNLAGPLSSTPAGAGPSSSAAANPGQCSSSGWRDASCGALDIGCGLQNLWGSLSCSLQNAFRQVGAGFQLLVGLLVLGVGLALIFNQTQVGRQVRQAVGRSASLAELAAL